MPGLMDSIHWTNVKECLEDHYNNHFTQLFEQEVDEHGFREIRRKKFNVLNS